MKKTLIILSMVVVLVILSFFVDHDGEYGRSGGEVESQTQAIAPHYEPQFQLLYEPVGGEIEGLLFALQGPLDVAVILYILGYTKGKQRRDNRA